MLSTLRNRPDSPRFTVFNAVMCQEAVMPMSDTAGEASATSCSYPARPCILACWSECHVERLIQ